MYLMHMDETVAKIEVMDGKFISVPQIFNGQLMPVGVSSQSPNLPLLLQNWDDMRSIPSERQNMDRILRAIPGGLSEAKRQSLRVSLTDTYWMKEENMQFSWNDVNFHDNGFATDFADVAVFEKNIPIVSFADPDYTTDGVLRKGWISMNHRPVLLKFGDLGQNAKKTNLLSANEVIASKVAEEMGICHVYYFPVCVEESKQIVCGSHCFITDAGKDFVTGLQIAHVHHSFGRELYHRFCAMGCQKEVDRMLLLDHLLHNTDRHEKNFGIIRDAATLETIQFAPLFDSGSCLGWNYNPALLQTGETKPFARKREQQLNFLQKLPCDVPDPNFVKAVIADTYELFGIKERQYQIACNDLEKSYQILLEKEHLYQIPKGLNEEERE